MHLQTAALLPARLACKSESSLIVTTSVQIWPGHAESFTNKLQSSDGLQPNKIAMASTYIVVSCFSLLKKEYGCCSNMPATHVLSGLRTDLHRSSKTLCFLQTSFGGIWIMAVSVSEIKSWHETSNKMEPTNPNANICPNDTLVGNSCGTLL